MVLFDKETNLPIYETPDEIPLKEHIVPPINMDGLPEYNLILKFMDCLSSESDAYPEYGMQGGLITLCTLSRCRVFVRLNGSDRFPLLWMVSLGPSGVGRKTVALNKTTEVIESVMGEAVILSDDVTPAGLIADMATKTFLRGTGSNSTGWGDVSEKYVDDECKIKRSQRVYIRDEASQMYAQMREHGKGSLQWLLLKLHSHKTFKKLLVNKKEFIEEPFFPTFVATTPEGFRKHMTKEHISTGFLPRHGITNPQYDKARKPLQEDGESDDQVMQDMINEFKLLDSVLGDGDTRIRASFQDGALEMLDSWACERETYYKQKRDEDHLVFIPRYQENALSMALLIELGNIPHIMEERGENKNVLLKSLKISKTSMGFALKLIDSVFSPYNDTLGLRDESIRFENGNVAKVERLLKKHRKLDYSTIMRNTGIRAGPLNEIIENLLAAGVIEKCYAKKGDSRQKGLWIVYVPPDTTKSIFETDYRKIQIDEYTHEMTFEQKPDLPDSLDEEVNSILDSSLSSNDVGSVVFIT